MTCDIFIKSYPPDFERLHYCLRSLMKYAKGFRCVVIVVPPGHGLRLTCEEVVEIDEQQPGYLFQQVCKMNADCHTDADYYWHIDSDCVLTREITPQEFMVNGRPRWLITPWKDCLASKKHWFHIMAKAVQQCPEHEFMRRHGAMIPRFAYGEFRKFMEETHGLPLDAYIMNQPGHEFSEFNCIGFYLWCFHREKIHWHDTSIDGIPPDPIKQAWSWGGMNNAERIELECLLA